MSRVIKAFAVLAVVLVILGWLVGDTTPQTTPDPAGGGPTTEPATAPSTTTPTPTPAVTAPAPPRLELLSSTGRRSSDAYITIEGQVKNISAESMPSLMVVVTILDKDGGFITSDSGLVEYDPLLPGQVSPFKAIVRFNPAFDQYRVEFKRIGRGSTIDYRDSRK